LVTQLSLQPYKRHSESVNYATNHVINAQQHQISFVFNAQTVIIRRLIPIAACNVFHVTLYVSNALEKLNSIAQHASLSLYCIVKVVLKSARNFLECLLIHIYYSAGLAIQFVSHVQAQHNLNAYNV